MQTSPTSIPTGLRYYDIISGLFVAVLLISNVAATKIVSFGAFPFDGATLLFPMVYIFGDILTEVYGFSRARRVIWLGFFANALAAITFAAVSALPPAPFWEHQAAFQTILGFVPRIVLASFIAYLCGEFVNSVILAKLKVKMQGKMLWVRTISSTLIGQAVDTLLFVTLAFGGVIPTHELWMMMAFNYMFKCAIEIAFTPFTYLIVNALKRGEGIDVYDTRTNFNPFKMFSAQTN